MSDYSKLLSKMLFGEDLKNTLQILPDYDSSVRNLDAGTRLIELMDIYKVFVPQNLSLEIYTKLYMMTVMSLQQKGTVDATRQLNANHRAILLIRSIEVLLLEHRRVQLSVLLGVEKQHLYNVL